MCLCNLTSNLHVAHILLLLTVFSRCWLIHLTCLNREIAVYYFYHGPVFRRIGTHREVSMQISCLWWCIGHCLASINRRQVEISFTHSICIALCKPKFFRIIVIDNDIATVLLLILVVLKVQVLLIVTVVLINVGIVTSCLFGRWHSWETLFVLQIRIGGLRLICDWGSHSLARRSVAAWLSWCVRRCRRHLWSHRIVTGQRLLLD